MTTRDGRHSCRKSGCTQLLAKIQKRPKPLTKTLIYVRFAWVDVRDPAKNRNKAVMQPSEEGWAGGGDATITQFDPNHPITRNKTAMGQLAMPVGPSKWMVPTAPRESHLFIIVSRSRSSSEVQAGPRGGIFRELEPLSSQEVSECLERLERFAEEMGESPNPTPFHPPRISAPPTPPLSDDGSERQDNAGPQGSESAVEGVPRGPVSSTGVP